MTSKQRSELLANIVQLDGSSSAAVTGLKAVYKEQHKSSSTAVSPSQGHEGLPTHPELHEDQEPHPAEVGDAGSTTSGIASDSNGESSSQV